MSDDDNLDVIKQIGKGSFSNVYLCKRPVSSMFGLSQQEFVFIVKEINIDALVSKYMKNKICTPTPKVTISPMIPNITPCNKLSIKDRSREEEYYYKRLHDLIESEIEVLYMLKHVNIIKIFNSTKNAYKYNLHMEYCELGDVYQYSKTNNIDNAFVSLFTKQMNDALTYIHSCNIIHRDIKLQNILVSRKNKSLVFKLSDFGFACYDLSSKLKSNDLDDIVAKKYYKLCGTPFYMAPEILLNMKKLENITLYDNSHRQFSNLFYDKQVDLWSFGICLYELIHKTLPFENIKNIKDLESFYKKSNVQEFFDKKTSNNNVLRQLLQINPRDRRLPQDDMDVFTDVTEILNKNEPKTEPKEELKQHIVSAPISNESNVFESWQYIHKSSSLLNKLGVGGGFFDWLMKRS